MELNEAALDKAVRGYLQGEGSVRDSMVVAIQTYLTEAFKPGQVQMLEPLEAIPQRDYRAELWLGVAIAATTNRTGPGTPAEQANNAVRAFDKTFPQEPTHG